MSEKYSKKDQSLYSSRTTVDNRRVVQSSKAELAKRKRIDYRRAVIVRSKVERPLTLPSSIFSKLNYYFMHASKFSFHLRHACVVLTSDLTYVLLRVSVFL